MNQQKNKTKILVIAHDAGGAEIIAAYINVHKEHIFFCYVQGPATKIFRREHIPFKNIANVQTEVIRVVRKHTSVDLVLLGTGWVTKIEAWALEAAKAAGLKTACYLESWVNYRERFAYPARGWKKNLPNEIWVGDEHALLLAEQYFSSYTRIRFVRNQYFKNLQVKAKKLRKEYPRPSGIFFLSDAVPGVELLLEQLLTCLVQMKYQEGVRIGLHPSDPKDRYAVLIKRYSESIPVLYAGKKDLVCNLLSARVVVGAETVALVVSVLLGKKTICIKKKGKHLLPFPEITYISDMAKISRLI